MSSRPARAFVIPILSLRHHLAKLCATLIIGTALTGCAAQMAYRDGRDLLAQGNMEAGLAKLQEAMRQDPEATEYKISYMQTRDRVVSAYIEQADGLVSAKKWNEAEALYRRALNLHPASDRALAGLQAIDTGQRHQKLFAEAETAWSKKDIGEAKSTLATILAENPQHAAALQLKRRIEERTAKSPAESALAAAYKKPITIEFKDVALKQIFEVISRTSGLNFLFDKDIKTDQKTSIFLKNSTIESAVYFMLLTNQLEQQVLDGNTILIYPNTAAKQKDYQEMVVRSFFLANAEAKSVANTLKTIVKSRDIVIDEKLNMLIVRDSPEAIKLVEKLIALHDQPEPEVMLEVEILEVKRTRLQELGIAWPDTVTLTPLPATAGGTLTLRGLRNIDRDTIGVGVGSVSLNAKLLDSDANILANPRIRARNHEKAKILIGERVPNITTTATSTGFVSESINYVDVGLKLDVEPTIYLDNDVAIKVSLEVSNIVSQLQTKSGSVAYQIGTRTASTVLRLKDGETQVLAGLINDEDRSSGNKVPGLGEIPVVGRLFGSTTDNSQKTEIVLSITPRIIRNIQRPNASVAEFRGGTDSSFRLRPGGHALVAEPVEPSTTNKPAASPPQLQQRSRTPVADNIPPPTDTPLPPPTEEVVHSSNGALNTSDQPPVDTILRWQGPPQSKKGETFSIQLLMQPDQPIMRLPLAIGFDNKALQVVSVAEGDFLKQDGAQSTFTSRVDPNGQILLTGTRSGNGGAVKPGVVATIGFRATEPMEATHIRVLTISPSDVAGRPISVPLPAPHTMQLQP